MTPDVMFHAAAGATTLVSGAIALAARKGGRLHRASGSLFFGAMLLTAGSAIYLGVTRDQTLNALAGILTLYFVITAWMTVRRPARRSGWPEMAACAIAAAGAAITFYLAYASVRAGHAFMGGIPYYSFSAVAALCALLDLSVIVRRGIVGRQRIARHLWRMHLGLFAAVGSFFPGPLQFFPDYIQHIRPFILLFIPPFSVAGLMLCWLIYVALTHRFAVPEAGVQDREPLARAPL
jgi:hypothetical protein